MKVLLAGSSHRRAGSGGWTLVEPVERFLRVVQPEEVAHGASPAGGLDTIADDAAVAYYRARGLDPEEHVRRFPMRPEVDGAGGFLRRNARMGASFEPDLGAAFCVGRVGECVGTRGHYLSNGTDSMVSWLHVHRVPTVVFREDGVEPHSNPSVALGALRRLYVVTRDERLIPPGLALRMFAEISETPTSREEVLTALACAREGSRWAPWIEAVEKTVAREQTGRLAG